MNISVFFFRLSQNGILECAFFKLLPFIEKDIDKLGLLLGYRQILEN